MRDRDNRPTGVAEFWIMAMEDVAEVDGDDEVEPDLTFAGRVGEVFEEIGLWHRINHVVAVPGTGDFFDRFEGYVVPPEQLIALATVCREIAATLVDSDRYQTTHSFYSWSEQRWLEAVVEVTGSQLRNALAALADLADRARNEGKTINAGLG